MTARWRAVAPGAVLALAGAALWQLNPAGDAHLSAAMTLAPDSVLRPALTLLTSIGGAAVLIPVAVAVVLWLLATRRYAQALWLFAVIASGRLLVEGMKLLFARPRPPAEDRLVEVLSSSFPSSHAAGSTLTALAICAALRAPPAGWAAALLFGAAVGVSRVLLGVHFPGDVLAGWGFALLWVGLALPLRSNGR